MSGRAPAPDLPPGPRLALIIATTTYADESLSQLRAPAHDAADLAAVLADPAIGAFTVTPLIDCTAHEIRLGVEDFLSGRGTDDLLVLYMSCHGIRDKRGRLYFAATDSRKTRLGATGVDSSWLVDQLDECRARRQVVILDCCFSGAFAVGAKGDPEVNLQRHLVGQGRGRAVLTASRAGEYSFEGEPLPGAVIAGSVFTSGMIEGMRSGAADTDQDGYISVEDAHDYAFEYVRKRGVAQTPQRWMYGAEGKIWLARSPAGAAIRPVPLPEALRTALDNPHPEIRLGVVATLGQWLTSDAGKALTARRELQQLAEAEIPRIAAAARALLSTHGADRAGSGNDLWAPVPPAAELAPAPALNSTPVIGDQHSLEAARREAKQIIEAAQREYDEIIARAEAQVQDASRIKAEALREVEKRRILAEQDAAIAQAAAEQASTRLKDAERLVEEKKAEAARLLTDAERERDRELRALSNEIEARREVANREDSKRRAELAQERDKRRAELAQERDAVRVQAERAVNGALAEARRLVSEATAVRVEQGLAMLDPQTLPEPNFAVVTRGYERSEVDRYLAGLRMFVTEAGGEEPPASPVFATARRGYSRDQVDYYIELVWHLISRISQSRTEQAALRSSVSTMFVNLARRSQILVDRLIGHLDRLERREEDPDRLVELFQLDHLATRMRRNDENLLVLAGADSTRVQREPAALIDVLRAAQSEVEHYPRIEFGIIDRDIEIAAHAVNDLVHLVAELFDNATAFSPPDSTVIVEARRVGDRAVLYVEDHGIGISPDQLAELNERLATPPMVDVAVSRMMGLVVVARLAARHGVKVELRAGVEWGTVAEMLLPAHVLVWRYTTGTKAP